MQGGVPQQGQQGGDWEALVLQRLGMPHNYLTYSMDETNGSGRKGKLLRVIFNAEGPDPDAVSRLQDDAAEENQDVVLELDYDKVGAVVPPCPWPSVPHDRFFGEGELVRSLEVASDDSFVGGGELDEKECKTWEGRCTAYVYGLC